MSPMPGPTRSSAPAGWGGGESADRERLGIPGGARRVLVFSESSHWDTNWLRTSGQYFETRVRPIFAAILRALERDPLRIYCIESVFFLKVFWERHPEERARVRVLLERAPASRAQLVVHHSRHLVAARRSHPARLSARPSMATCAGALDGSHGPHTSRTTSATPRTCRLSCARSGSTPVGLTRIDGMYFVASDFRRKSDFPIAGLDRGGPAEDLQDARLRMAGR
jgi:hypothetical protein